MFRQAGQSIVLFLAFIAAILGSMLVVFNVGQTTNAKMRAMNAADAAAYSGALWEARTLNLQAYLNRAMVANEVAIAQSVSLRSWIDYLQCFVGNFNLVSRWVPYLGEATQALATGLSRTDTVVQDLLPLGESALRVLNTATFEAEPVINTSGLVAEDVAKNVARSNGATISTGGLALMARDALKWKNFTADYKQSTGVVGTDGRTRLRAVALDSRDGFSQARDKTFGGPPVAEIRKQGGTDLLGFNSWKGLDSSQLDLAYIPIKGWTTTIPIGWGGAQAYTTEMRGYGLHGNVNDWQSEDGEIAVARSNESGYAKAIKGSGFPGYRDLSNMDQRPAPQRVADVHLEFAVEVLIDKAVVDTSESALQHANAVLNDGTVIDHHSNFAASDKGVFALSEACVRFARPYGATRTGGLEYPSLFNPYWRASLATVSKASRFLADSLKGLPEAALLEGAGSCS
jgi:hypothetical protein